MIIVKLAGHHVTNLVSNVITFIHADNPLLWTGYKYKFNVKIRIHTNDGSVECDPNSNQAERIIRALDLVG